MTAHPIAALTTVGLALVLVPAVVVVQLALLWFRNRVRDRLHAETTPTAEESAPRRAGPDDDPSVDPLEAIIVEELGRVFDTAFAQHDDRIDDAGFRDLILDLAGTTAQRVAARAELSERDRQRLDFEIAVAVLGAFGMAAPALN